MFFASVFSFTNSAYLLFIMKKSSFGPHLKIIGICYYAIVLKEEKKKQKDHTHNSL